MLPMPHGTNMYHGQVDNPPDIVPQHPQPPWSHTYDIPSCLISHNGTYFPPPPGHELVTTSEGYQQMQAIDDVFMPNDTPMTAEPALPVPNSQLQHQRSLHTGNASSNGSNVDLLNGTVMRATPKGTSMKSGSRLGKIWDPHIGASCSSNIRLPKRKNFHNEKSSRRKKFVSEDYMMNKMKRLSLESSFQVGKRGAKSMQEMEESLQSVDDGDDEVDDVEDEESTDVKSVRDTRRRLHMTDALKDILDATKSRQCAVIQRVLPRPSMALVPWQPLQTINEAADTAEPSPPPPPPPPLTLTPPTPTVPSPPPPVAAGVAAVDVDMSGARYEPPWFVGGNEANNNDYSVGSFHLQQVMANVPLPPDDDMDL